MQKRKKKKKKIDKQRFTLDGKDSVVNISLPSESFRVGEGGGGRCIPSGVN